MSLQVNTSNGSGPAYQRNSPRRPPPSPLPIPTQAFPSPLSSAVLPSETPVPHTPTHGLLAQLGHLLPPRHTLFHVRLHIHEIASVPLITGEFGVKWRFKNVHHVPGSRPGFLGMVKKRNRSRPRTPSRKSHDDDNDEPGQATARPVVAESLESSRSEPDSPQAGSSEDTPSIPSVVVSRHGSGISQPSTPISALPPSLSPSMSSSRIPTLSELSSHLYQQPEEQSTLSLSATTPVDGYSSSRGMTSYGHLKEHRVKWEHKVDVVVKMDVERDTMELLPNELKLEVMQRVIPNDPSSPQNPRLGVLYLNLAQYASVPSVTRRYLLQKSKTNATLKLTVQLECIGGEKGYIAPPLPKGEILGGVKGVLDSDVLRLRPRIAGLERGMAAAMGGSMGMFSPDIASIYGPGVRRTDSTGVEKVQILDKEYTLDSLGLSYGPKITENLIDAIFNPLPTTDKDKEGPFTYYVDPNSISTSTEDETVSPSPSSPSSESNSNDRISRTSHPAHADSVSVYSTESSASESHRSHRSHQSTTSTHSSLGIGLGVGLPSVGGMSVSEQRRGSGESYNSSDGVIAEPVGRMKGWWRKLGHGHTHEHQVPGAEASSMDRQDTIMPAIAPSPSMPAMSITT